MKNLFGTGWLAVSLALASTTPGMAQVVRVGGGLHRGFARPPLLVNLRPAQGHGRVSYGPYSPAQIRHAYGIDQLPLTGSGQAVNGSGQIIGIVDAYGDPSIQTDLNNFCAYFGIPSTTVTIIYPQGQPTGGNSGWALETALDVEWAHAIAPGATIILSVAKSNSYADLLGAIDAAVIAGARVISMSWGGTESPANLAYDGHFVSGVTFVASSGDSGELTRGPEVEWPASSPYVVGVGGTSLYLDASGNRVSNKPETAWAGSGGGLSSNYGRPSWQNVWQGYGKRGVPDVSLVADPSTGVYVVYSGYSYEVGGTSVGAPQWAALVALANQAGGTVLGSGANAAIYSLAGTAPSINPTYFIDIISGNNGSNRDKDDYAVTGYDLVTGLGSPLANSLVPVLH